MRLPCNHAGIAGDDDCYVVLSWMAETRRRRGSSAAESAAEGQRYRGFSVPIRVV